MRIFTSHKLFIWAAPLALLGLAVVVYGPFLPQLGFYWDDWVFAWTRSQMGAQGLIDLFSVTRPIRGWIEAGLTPLLGVNPLAWQVYALLMRWLAAVSLWWFLYTLWPQRRAESLFAAALLLVYPGYSQQPLAMTYHYFWTFAAIFFLSFALMARSLQTGKTVWWLFGLSVTLSAVQLTAMEYLVGLELLRPLVLLLMFARLVPMWTERLKKTVLFELPYAVVLGFYLYWRFFLFSNAIYSPDLIARAESSPVTTLTNLIGAIGNALSQVNVDAWLRIVSLPAFAEFGLALSVMYLFVVLGTLSGTVILFAHIDSGEKPPLDWIIVGLGGMILAGFPFFIAGLPFRVVFPEDRFTLPFIPLIGLFVTGLIWLLRNSAQRALAAGLVIALAAGYQVQSLKLYRDDWRVQKNFIWQLAWRAPNLTNGTLVVSEDYDTFRYNDDESLSTLINWAYIPGNTVLPNLNSYAFISLRLSTELPELLKSADGSPAPILVTRFAPPACLHIFDPRYDEVLLSLPNPSTFKAISAFEPVFLPDLTRQAVPLSNPSLTTGGVFPADVPDFLGPEPIRGWCYTYLKADLARQQGEWQQVAHLGDEAFAIPMLPDDPYEYLPFIEAYARLGRIKDARMLTRQVAEDAPLLRPALCALWNRVPGVSPDTLKEMRQQLHICPVIP